MNSPFVAGPLDRMLGFAALFPTYRMRLITDLPMCPPPCFSSFHFAHYEGMSHFVTATPWQVSLSAPSLMTM